MKKKFSIKTVIGWLLCCVGFIIFVFFMTKESSISIEAWWNAVFASVGLTMFVIGSYTT